MDFTSTEFWVQIHGLPLNRQKKSNLLMIGRFIGRVTDIDLSGSGGGQWRNFVKVRVEMDISTPLLSGFPMDREQLSVLWIPLKYEKLGNFCYGCGRLGHEQRDCPVSEVQKLIKEGVDMGLFGRWLRADNPDYHPGINKQLLLEAKRAECNTEIRFLIRMAGGSSGDVHSTPQCEKTKDNSR